MRSPLVSAALVLVVAAASSCHVFPVRSGPSRAGTPSAGGDPAPPSGLRTRATYRLPNGLRVVLEENHAAPVVALQAWIGAGSSNDPAGQEGLAHFFQHLLLQSAGVSVSGATQAIRDLAAVRARVGAWTTVDDIVVAGVLAAPFIDVGVRALAALLMQPSLAPPDIEVARRAARDDLRQASQVPARVAAQSALTAAFPGHPYGRPLLGTDASLASLGVTEVQAFWEAFYSPDNTTLVIVGDFDAVATRALLLAAFGGWQPRRGRPSSATASHPDDVTTPQVAVFTAQIPAPEVAIAFRIPGMKAADMPALELLAALLGPGRGGRLEGEVVRNRQLVTTPRAFLFNAHQGGLLITTATLGAGRADEAARAVRDEILRLTREQVSPDELARARTLVEGAGATEKATIGGYARKLGMSMAVAGDPTFEATYLDRLRKVDPADVRKVAARTFVLPNLSVTVVLPTARDPQRDDRAAGLLPRLRTVANAPTAPESAPTATTAAVAVSGHDVREYLLPSGVRLLVLRDDTAPQLSVRAIWSGGVRVQDARLAGASSLLARLFPRATKTRPADVLASDIAEIAGAIDGAAGIDSLTVRGDFLASRWERGLELMVDCLRNPRLSDEDIERERRVLLDAIRARNDDATEIALRLFRGALFGRHPYNQDLLGTSDSVAALNRRRLLDHFRQHYGPRGLTVAVLGPVEPDRVSAKLQSLFADLRPVAGERRREQDLPAVIVQPPHTEPTEVFQFITQDQGRLVLGFPGVTLRDPDRYALEVLAELVGGAGGRLGTAAMRALGVLPDQAGAVSYEGVDPGYFAVYVTARPDTLDAIVPALRAELRLLVEGGATEEEVARARRILMGNRALSLERRGAVAMAVALNGVFGGVGRAYRRDVDELARVTPADVARAARRILDPRREVLAVVRPRDPTAPGQRNTTSTSSVLKVQPPPPRYTSR